MTSYGNSSQQDQTHTPHWMIVVWAVRNEAIVCFRPPPDRFGQFISSTLPTFAVCEKFVVMEINNEEKIDGGKLNEIKIWVARYIFS